jgi:hypothetical protein
MVRTVHAFIHPLWSRAQDEKLERTIVGDGRHDSRARGARRVGDRVPGTIQVRNSSIGESLYGLALHLLKGLRRKTCVTC